MTFRKYIENLPILRNESEKELFGDEPYLFYRKPMLLKEYFCPVCHEIGEVLVYRVNFKGKNIFISFVHPDGKTENCVREYENSKARKYNYKNINYEKRLEQISKTLNDDFIDESIRINYEE